MTFGAGAYGYSTQVILDITGYFLAGAGGGTGPQGPAGPAGPAGPQGPSGPSGSTGTAGTAGADGKTILYGSGAPAGGLGVDGDFYIDTTAKTIAGPKATTWPAGTSLVGPAGSVDYKAGTGTTADDSGSQRLTVTFADPFADDNYSISLTYVGAGPAPTLWVVSKTATGAGFVVGTGSTIPINVLWLAIPSNDP